ncbi:HNH endonuclease signature motif containing protein [Actinomadura alba]|uniref:DUF222 domain-containing protein n=1 Tax=Actinomadura alba TaxID=406431 RepID=A0ABR7LQ42_9ACTN|nr:HNH endonuclease signature motif containing protein [Actinomadura alba]MBC6466871.1 DUF222 domain-containing protein [Actinomadura alba]
MVEAAWDFLNSDDLPTLPVLTQAELLHAWSRLQAKESAAYASLIGAFHSANGPAADGQRSVGAWLARFTRCTPAAGKRLVGWSLRQLRHAHVHQSLADGQVTESVGQLITDLVKEFEPADRDTIEEILTEAASSGAELDDLVEIHNAALRRLRPNGLEDEEARRDAERNLTLSKTLGGVGRLNGDLTAEGTALTETVIEALAVKQGPEDTRTKTQRRHDALVEAMRRLAASNLLPERGGSKPQVKVGMDLATLRNLPGSRQAEQEWVERTAANLARRRFHGDTTNDLLIDDDPAPGPPSGPPTESLPKTASGDDTRTGDEADPYANELDGGPIEASDADVPVRPGGRVQRSVQPELPGLGAGAVLEGIGAISDTLAAAIACDSTLTPTVIANIDYDALNAMTDEWLNHHLTQSTTGATCSACAGHTAEQNTRSHEPDPPDKGHAHDCQPVSGPVRDSDCGSTCGPGPGPDRGCGCDGSSFEHARRPLDADSYACLQAGMLRWAVAVLSGPGGLASYLRTRLLDRPLAGPSIVLDAGKDDKTVPAALERLVRRRDQGCRFPGCHHTAPLSQVHHIIPRSKDGPTELWNLLTLCSFHHLIAVHSWGWDIQLNPDGTTTATAPDGRVLHEHHPPGTPPLWAA